MKSRQMPAKSVGRPMSHSPKCTIDPFFGNSFRPPEAMNPEEALLRGIDPSYLRSYTPYAFPALTQEARADAVRKLQLVQLLKQVNPNLQLSQKSPNRKQPITAEKGTQVPDIRYEFLNNRRFATTSRNPEVKASYTAPGVRIQPRTQSRAKTDTTGLHSTPNQAKPNALKPSATVNGRRRSPSPPQQVSEEPDLRILAASAATENSRNAVLPSVPEKIDKNLEAAQNHDTEEEEKLDKTDGVKQNGKVAAKSKDSSSGDEDSVVVVLNQPRSEQGLERKYGQFFCRRCLRGWSSRSVWCVRHTSKVYIKQTCNLCNKLVNPYLVCSLPPTRKDRK